MKTLIEQLNDQHKTNLAAIEKENNEKELLAAAQAYGASLERLRAELIRQQQSNLQQSITPQQNDETEQETAVPPPKPSTWKHIFLFIVSFILTFLAAADGLDGLLGITAFFAPGAIPLAVIGVLGALFIGANVLIVLSLDRIKIAKNLGISVKNISGLLISYEKEIETIREIIKNIQNNFHHYDGPHLEDKSVLLAQLKERCIFLIAQGDKFKQKGETNPFLKALKFCMTTINCALFFCGGFFLGKATLLSIFPALLVVSAPVLITGALLGLGGVFGFWYFQRTAVNKLIESWFDIDQKKVETLCHASDEIKEITILEQQLATRSKEQIYTEELKKENTELKNTQIDLQTACQELRHANALLFKKIAALSPPITATPKNKDSSTYRSQSFSFSPSEKERKEHDEKKTVHSFN